MEVCIYHVLSCPIYLCQAIFVSHRCFLTRPQTRMVFTGFQTINILALGYSLVRLLSKDLNVQILGFLFFSFFRCFLFGVTFSVFPILHSPDVVGKAMGVTFAAAGITAFINIPLSTIAIEQQDGDFFLPNLMYTILILPCIYLSWSLTEVINQEGRIRKKRQQSFN